jgi:hypothetical protein
MGEDNSYVTEADDPAQQFKVPAEVHSDDRLYSAEFDALHWFQNAADTCIVQLAKCDWGGDYPADEVAYYFASPLPSLNAVFDEEVAAVLDYCQRVTSAGGTCGFECHVDASAAMRWLKVNRPDVYGRIAADGRWD